MRPAIRNRLIPFFAAFVLMVHTLLPFFAVYQLPAIPDAKNLTSLFGDKILLCSPGGFRFVSVKDLMSGKEHPQPHKQYQCALCYVAAHGQLIKPVLSASAPASGQVVYQIVLPLVPKSIQFSERDWQKRRTRSPPAAFTA